MTPADPGGVYERVVEKRVRRHLIRRAEAVLLTTVVLAGSAAGFLGLSTAFHRRGNSLPAIGSPYPIEQHANGSIAYTTGDRIIISNPDGANAQTIPSPAPGLAWHITWSPDGTRLAVAVFGDPGRSLWVMNADGSDPVEIADASNVSRPSWHPDGGSLTYSSEEHGVTAIHVVRSDGSDDRVVYSHDAPGTYAVFSSAFSPDGSRIVFDAGTDSGYDIFVMDPDGANVERLTETGTDYNPSWSPDGSRILFTRQEGASESDIFVMGADGSHVQRLTDDGPNFTNLNAEFSPDGASITYEAAKNGGTGPIEVMDPDGSNVRTLVSGSVLGFSWQPVPAGSSPTTSPQPERSETPEDVGLGFLVCDASTIAGTFRGDGIRGTASVVTRAGEQCPRPGHGMQVLAVDVNGDGVQDASFGPLECDPFCTAFATPDVDGDGTDEILVQNIQFSIAGVRLFDVIDDGGAASVVPVTVASPGYPGEGLAPGAEPQFWIGGDAFQADSLRCFEDDPPPAGPGRVLIQTSATQVDPDTPHATWHATATWFDLQPDGTVKIVDRGDFDEPARGTPSFAQGNDVCGARLPEPYRAG